MRIGSRSSVWMVLATLAAGATLSACAHQKTALFEDTQRRYTNMVRWSDWQRAVTEFMEPEEREAFEQRSSNLTTLRFADYEIRSFEMGPDQRSATVHVRYSAFRPSSPIQIAVDETQEWYQEEETGHWRVRSHLERVH
jgi:hypothetical protein